MDTKKVTRVEVIDEKGRSYVNWNKNNVVKLSLQDDERTLKVFISRNTVIHDQDYSPDILDNL